MECSKCNFLFCKKCIEDWLKIKKECPKRCKMSQDAVIKPASKVICKIIHKLIISCKRCNEKFKVEQIDEHERICKISLCGNPLCKKIISNDLKLDSSNSVAVCSEKCRLIWLFDKNCKAKKGSPILEIVQDLVFKIKMDQDNQGKSNSDTMNQVADLVSTNPESRQPQNSLIEFIWEKDLIPSKIQISSDYRQLLLNESEFKYRNVYGNTGFCAGVHYWEIIIDSLTQNDIKIGISKTRNVDLQGAFSDVEDGYAYFGMGELRHASDSTGSKYGKPFLKYSHVGVFLDMRKGILGFSLNGEFFGIAFKDKLLEKGPIYPAISLLRKCSCTLASGLQVPLHIKV